MSALTRVPRVSMSRDPGQHNTKPPRSPTPLTPPGCPIHPTCFLSDGWESKPADPRLRGRQLADLLPLTVHWNWTYV